MSRRYNYVAVDAGGRTRSGVVAARTEAEARADLAKRRLLPVQIAPEAPVRTTAAAAKGADRGAGLFGPRQGLTHAQRLVFTRQLATLVDAAVPVDEALATIAAQQETPAIARLVQEVLEGVQEGQRLTDALGRRPAAFSPLYRAAVAGGERSGRLGFVLQRLAGYLGTAQALRSKITTALIYPAALVIVATGVISSMMIFVVPTLTEQFRAFDAPLPLITQILIAVSGFLAAFWPLVLAAIAGVVLGVRALLRQEGPRSQFDASLLRAPLIGRWVTAVNASRFIRAVAMLTAAGLPVLDALQASRDAVANKAVAAGIAAIAAAVEEGEPLSHAMRASGVIPPMVTYMTASGENAGELPAMLDKAADHLDQDFEAFSARALSLLEPAIIVLMGGAVAGIVLSIMLPILQLNRMAIG